MFKRRVAGRMMGRSDVYPFRDPLNRDDGGHRHRDREEERTTVGEAYRSVNLFLGLALFTIGKGWVWLMEAAIIAAMLASLLVVSSAPAVTVVVVVIGVVALVAIGLIVQFSLEDWVNDYNDRLDQERRRSGPHGPDPEDSSR